MHNERPTIEEQRDFDPAREKRTLPNNREAGGLNADNPNTDRTPATSAEEASAEMHQEQGDNTTGA